MFASLLGAIRADIDRQVDWAKAEVRRQAGYTVLTGVLAAVAVLAALSAAGVGITALYFWLVMQVDPFVALGIIGGGLVLLALILFAVAFVRKRPRLALRPRLQIAQPTALVETLWPRSYGRTTASGKRMLAPTTETVRQSSRPALLGTLLLVAMVGLIAGRRLRPSARSALE
jgi:hypothetical protein